ncbi:hypothetical protein DYB30_006686 [Aphanomyces astaci]|uniref:Conserved oligomeric Golgi complex subunit 3 n=1 Tax=Aphanomyces astaci TaxID=112090 RepID=A0A397DIT4_APHAT|nr:hypothetical protein DYB36_007704 [Aphanomyces astaci]RHY62863.1 hypothetical protein DYB30_006686 [Aphanomyces astaci]
MSLKQYYALKVSATPLATNTPVPLSSTIQEFMTNAQTCYRVCETVEEHTEKSLALLQEMEDRHVSVKTLTSALYESFETLLTELDALNVKVQSLEGPLPYFTRISSIAKAVGTNESFLPDVLDTYVTVRTQLVTPVVDAYLTSVNQSTDIVSLHNLDVLCEIVEVLRREVVDTHIRPMGDAAEAVEPVVDRMIGDAQERLILCTQKYLRDEIEAFVPTLADLNYPDKLLGACATPTVYATWYPTLEHTLMCLSKVYRYVNMHIFEELAQDAVRMCTATLNMASADIAVEKSFVRFQVFTCFVLDAMGNILNGNILTDAFTLSVDNSILGLLTHGIPHVHTTTSDVKKTGLADVVEQLQGILEKEYSAQDRAVCDADVQALMQRIVHEM